MSRKRLVKKIVKQLSVEDAIKIILASLSHSAKAAAEEYYPQSNLDVIIDAGIECGKERIK